MPRKLKDIKMMAKGYGPAAIHILHGIMSSDGCPPQARVVAARELLDRGYGKAVATLEATHEHRVLIERVERMILDPKSVTVNAHPMLVTSRIPEDDDTDSTVNTINGLGDTDTS